MSQQCPRCRRHKHEEFIDKDKSGKRWLIDRCAATECHYNFDIKEDKELDKFKDLDLETDPNTDDQKPKGVNRKPKGGWLV